MEAIRAGNKIVRPFAMPEGGHDLRRAGPFACGVSRARGRLVSAPKAPTITKEQGVTVIARGADYENLNDSGFERSTACCSRRQPTADPPLLELDLSRLRFFGSGFIEVAVSGVERAQRRARAGGCRSAG